MHYFVVSEERIGVVSMLFMNLLTGPYDIFEKQKVPGAYAPLGQKTYRAEVYIYEILLTVGVYASLITFLISLICYVAPVLGHSAKLAESKKLIAKVIIVSGLIFAVTGAVELIQGIGLDNR